MQVKKDQPHEKKHSVIFFLKALCTVGLLMVSFCIARPASANSCQSNTASGNWNVSGSWTNCGGMTPQVTDTIQILNGHTITITDANKTVLGAQVDLGGRLALGSFTLIDMGVGTGINGLTVNGTLSGTGGVTVNGVAQTIDGTGTISATGTFTFSTSASFAATANLTIAGPVSIAALVTVTNNGIVSITNTAGIVGAASTATWTQAANSTLNFGGNTTSLLSTGTLNASNTGNTVNYNGSNQTCKVVTYYHLTLSNSGTKTCQATTVSGNMTLTGSVLLTSSAVMSIAGNLTVSGTSTLSTAAFTFTVTGTTTVSGGTLSVMNNTGAKTFTGLVTVSSGTFSGASTQMVFQGGITQSSSGTVSLTGTATFNTNSQALNGTQAIASITVTAVTLTNYGALTVGTALSGSGGFVNESTGTLNFGAASIAITTFTASASGNTVNYNRSNIQTCKPVTYHHLSFTGASAKTCSATTVNGNLTIGGTASWSLNASLIVSGTLTISGGTLTTSTVNFLVSGTTTISSGTFTVSGNTGTKTFTGLVTVSGGTFNGTSTQAIFQGGITQSSTGTVSLTGTATFNTNSQELNGTIAIATIAVASGTLTNNGTLSVSTALSGAGGFTNGATGTFNYGGSGAPSVSTVNFSTTGNTVNYDRVGSQSCVVATYYHLIFSGTSTKTCAVTTINGNMSMQGMAIWTTTATVTIAGNLISAASSTFTTGAFAFTVSGTSTIEGTVTVNSSGVKTFAQEVTVNGSGILNGDSTTIVFQNSLTNTTGTVSLTGAASFTTNAQHISGTVSIGAVTVTSIVLTNQGDATVGALSGSGTWTQSANSVLALTGAATIATLTATASGNTVLYNNTSSGQTVLGITYRNLTIFTTGQTATLGGDVVVSGNLVISSGTLDAGSDYDITLAGNFTNSGIFTARAGILTLNGASAQTLTGAFTNASALGTLIITNSSGVDDPGCGTSFTPGVIFASSLTASLFQIQTASVRVQYASGGTYTFEQIFWDGQSSGTPIFFRNSSLSSGTWSVVVTGSQTVRAVNVARSNASGGSYIFANDGTSMDCGSNTAWTFAVGVLSVNIVDGSGVSVLSPSVVMSAIATTLHMQTTTGTLGTSSQRIRVTNTTAAPAWTLSIAPTLGAAAVWSGSAGTYDVNDATSGALDGVDADSVGGQLTINPSIATITPQDGCATTGLSLGSSASLQEDAVNAITILSSTSLSDVLCYWELTGIGVSQTIPAGQSSGNDYSIDFTLTITAS